MLDMLRKRRDNEEGFTLIELMVVVLIIGILLAIAVPTFLSAQNSAKAKAAGSNARSALSAVKTVYTDTQSYDAVSTSVAALVAAEPSLGWVASPTASTSPATISVASPGAAPGTQIGIAVQSKLGDCFYILDDVSAGGGGTKFARANKVGGALPTCDGATALAGVTGAGNSPDSSNPKW